MLAFNHFFGLINFTVSTEVTYYVSFYFILLIWGVRLYAGGLRLLFSLMLAGMIYMWP